MGRKNGFLYYAEMYKLSFAFLHICYLQFTFVLLYQNPKDG